MNKECCVYLELLCPLSLELFLWTTLHGVRSGDSSPPSTAVDELVASLRERELLGAWFANHVANRSIEPICRISFDVSGLNRKL